MLAPSLIAGPETTPVSLQEAKAHLRVDFDDDDALIEGLVAAVTAHLDGPAGVLGRALVTQTWLQAFDEWPDEDDCGSLRLPIAPVSEIVSITYFDSQNAEQTVSAPGNYALLHDDRGAYVRFTPTFAAPALYYDREDRVRVTFKAGYGAAAAVPAAIKSAILLMIGDLYAARETFMAGGGAGQVATSVPVDFLLLPYRRVWS